MSKSFVLSLPLALALFGAGCAPDDSDALDGQGTTTNSNDAAAVGGGLSDAGGATGSPGVDASSESGGSGGMAGSGFADSGPGSQPDASFVDAASAMPDAAAGGADAGALSDGGSQGAVGDGGNPDSAVATQAPSPGCGKAGRPSGGRVSVQGDHNYTFPMTYDGTQPFPLLIGFHAAGNPIDQIEKLTNGSDFEKDYVRAFPKSKGSAWDYNTDIGKVKAMYEDLLANYCFDTSRVFATGHSSGAQLIVQILTPAHNADADQFGFRAVAPVAASRYGTVSRPMPVLYIQGQHDMVRNSDGSDVVKEFVAANGCAMTSKPYADAPMCTSGGNTVNDGCIQYDGCQVPTLWCSHDDPQYSNTHHGWPCFATKAMYDFFKTLW